MGLNDVEVSQVFREAGGTFRDELYDFTIFAFGPRIEGGWEPDLSIDEWVKDIIPKKGRYAPSLIARSEVELFGVSTPRFVFRLYFEGDAEGSFINVRRIGVLSSYLDNFPGYYFKRIPPTDHQYYEIDDDHLAGKPSQSIVNNVSLVDGLLGVPNYLKGNDRLFFNTAQLLMEQGEFDSGMTWVSPFASTSSIAGGLCAQACCYMATVMMHEHIDRACGLADITALGRSSHHATPKTAPTTSPPDMLIAGMNDVEMCRYFEQIGLRAMVQNYAIFDGSKFKEERMKQEHLVIALTSYVASKLPVILMVDAAKMTSIYSRNGLEPLVDDDDEAPHAILVVGAEKNLSDLEDVLDAEFVIHDPSSAPFIRANGRDLVELGMQSTHDHFGNMPVMIGIHPRSLQMPLLDFCVDDDQKPFRGLIELSHLKEPKDYEKRPFHLIRLGDFKDSTDRLLPSHVRREVGSAYQLVDFISDGSVDRVLENSGFEIGHWFWSEMVSSPVLCLRIWDAEKGPNDRGSGKDFADWRYYWVGEIAVGDDKPLLFNDANNATAAQPSASEVAIGPKVAIQQPFNNITARAESQLEISILSSFEIEGPSPHVNADLHHCLISLQEQSKPSIELYTFMGPSLERYLPASASFAVVPPGDQLITSSTNPLRMVVEEYIRDPVGFPMTLADSSLNHWAPFTVNSFATFLPEIQSPIDAVSELACRYLAILVRCANHLREKNNREGLFTIELVGGPIFGGICPVRYRNGPAQNRRDIRSFVLEVRNPAEALEQLLDSLNRVITLAGMDSMNDLVFGIELEPGSLFAVGGPWALIELDRLLTSDPRYIGLSKYVGFNLDIAHWHSLSKINLDWLKGCAFLKYKAPNSDLDRWSSQQEGLSVAKRIVHAHISHHSKGHWADRRLDSNNLGRPVMDEYRPWLDFLKRMIHPVGRFQRPFNRPAFSGRVSIELEACKTKECMMDSIRALRRAL